MEQEERQVVIEPEKKSGWLTKLLKCSLWFIGGAVGLWLVWYLIVDRDVKRVPVTDVYDEVDFSQGEAPDYRALFDSLQERECLPASENGWVDVYRALGPKSIEQMATVERTKWEDYSTNRETGAAEVYERWHKPMCEKFGLDPDAKPTFYDRLEIVQYLVKHGVTGQEPEVALDPEEVKKRPDNPYGPYSYWEHGQDNCGKITREEANNEFSLRLTKPWTPDESPIVAQWIAENEDRYELIARAARQPKFRAWRFLPSLEEGSIVVTLLPDAQYIRELAREFELRANLRLGTGDISGAIDDVETIALLARSLLDSESAFLVERLVGLACLDVARSVGIDGSPVRAPTAEERARVVALWRADYGADTLAKRTEAWTRNEFLFECAAFLDCLELADRGEVKKLKEVTSESDDAKYPISSLLLRALPINKPKAFNYFRSTYLEIMKATPEEVDAKFAELQNMSIFARVSSKGFATAALYLLNPAFNAVHSAFARSDCSAKQADVAQAIWTYYDANGVFPPAFTVDESGRPLHSWRVLILPYLGDDAKALYDQIRLDEPWNSEHNSAFFAQMPEVYRCASAKTAKPGETLFSLLLSQDGIFDRSGVGKDPKAFMERDDRDFRYQAMLVESPAPFCWMQPDAEIDLDAALAHSHFAPSDGSVVEGSNVGALGDALGVQTHSGGCNTVTFSSGARYLSAMNLTNEAETLHMLCGIPEPEKEDDNSAEEVAAPSQE